MGLDDNWASLQRALVASIPCHSAVLVWCQVSECIPCFGTVMHCRVRCTHVPYPAEWVLLSRLAHPAVDHQSAIMTWSWALGDTTAGVHSRTEREHHSGVVERSTTTPRRVLHPHVMRDAYTPCTHTPEPSAIITHFMR